MCTFLFIFSHLLVIWFLNIRCFVFSQQMRCVYIIVAYSIAEYDVTLKLQRTLKEDWLFLRGHKPLWNYRLWVLGATMNSVLTLYASSTYVRQNIYFQLFLFLIVQNIHRFNTYCICMRERKWQGTVSFFDIFRNSWNLITIYLHICGTHLTVCVCLKDNFNNCTHKSCLTQPQVSLWLVESPYTRDLLTCFIITNSSFFVIACGLNMNFYLERQQLLNSKLYYIYSLPQIL